MATIVDQILAQSQAGSANGEGFGQYFVEGMKLGQNKRALDQRDRQLAMEEATTRQMMDFNEQMQAYKLEEARLNMQKMVEVQKLGTGLSALQLDLLTSPDRASDPIWLGQAGTVLKNAAALGLPQGKTLFDMIKSSRDRKMAIDAGLGLYETRVGDETFRKVEKSVELTSEELKALEDQTKYRKVYRRDDKGHVTTTYEEIDPNAAARATNAAARIKLEQDRLQMRKDAQANPKDTFIQKWAPQIMLQSAIPTAPGEAAKMAADLYDELSKSSGGAPGSGISGPPGDRMNLFGEEK